MSKKVFLGAFAAFLTLSPVAHGLSADTGSWQALQAEAAWNHGNYRVERLAFADDVMGPYTFGNHVVVAEPVRSCRPNGCDRFDLTILKGGSKATISNVPGIILDEKRYHLNQDRLIFTNKIDDNGNHFSVSEINLEDATVKTLIKDVFFDNPTSLDVMVTSSQDGDQFYFNPEFGAASTGKAYRQAAVFVYDHAAEKAVPITNHWELRREELKDVQGTKTAVEALFEGGEHEVWIMDSATVDYRRGSMKAIPGTWTEKPGDIVGLHFLSDGGVEFFRNFVRTTYHPGDAKTVQHDGEFLNWFRPVQDSYQIMGGVMAWVNPEDVLFVTKNGGFPIKVGTAVGGKFHLTNESLFYATSKGGMSFDLTSNVQTELPLAVMQTANTSYLVGLNQDGKIVYMDQGKDTAVIVGFGTQPAISDSSHVFWRGTDGNIYSATIGLNSQVRGTSTSATATTGNGKFPIGTKVKTNDSPKVFVIGNDGATHWFSTEAVAQQIYGSAWNKDIITVSSQSLFDYKIGSTIQTTTDYVNLVAR